MIYIVGRFVGLNKKKSLLFTIPLIVLYLIFLSNYFFNYLPYYPDSRVFSEIITTNYFPEEKSIGVRQYYLFTYPIRLFSMFYLEIFIILTIALWFLKIRSTVAKPGKIFLSRILNTCFLKFFKLIPNV